MSQKINCFVRKLPLTFSRSIKQKEPEKPINMDLAMRQHENYTKLLKKLCNNVNVINDNNKCPDCCFVEDALMCIDNTLILCNPGETSRKPEVAEVERIIKSDYLHLPIYKINEPGHLDGGDVLFTGRDIFVGESKRTNQDAIDQLKKIFVGKFNVYSIPVKSLHLKSVISHLNKKVLITSICRLGKSIKREIEKLVPGKYEFVYVPDQAASNILSINNNIVIQSGFLNSETVFDDLAKRYKLNVHRLNMSEFIKADGALTCCSVFLR
jgi:dimethylargininase